MTKLERFINKAILKYGGQYDYSNVKYIDTLTRVNILCKEHGVFEKTPHHHLNRSQGCPKCGYKKLSIYKKSNVDDFIKKASKLHDTKYDYSNVVYIDAKTNVDILCKEHNNIFSMTPNNHLRGQVCSFCTGKKLNTKIFIERSKNIHTQYDYSNVEYKHSKEYVFITCKEHGDFKMKPNDHLNGKGCPACKNSKGERKIKYILEKLEIKYMSQYKFDDCKYKRELSFDFYLPDYNTCIEYDGVQHFKPIDIFGGVNRFEDDKVRDSIKNDYCVKNKIKIIRIPYYKFNDIQSILIENL